MRKRNKFLILFVFILVLGLTFPVFASDSMYTWSTSSNLTENSLSNDSNTNRSTDAVQINSKAVETLDKAGNFLNLESSSALLMEQNGGKVLYEHNSHEQLKPASVTKVMSLLLFMEAIDSGRINLQDVVPCSEKAMSMGGSQIWLDPRDELTVNDMLKAICVVSANDCTVAMAELLTGSEELFVEQMNQKAKELGMNDTTFKNCHGIDEDGHVTSSHDIAVMSRELMLNHPSITQYTTIWMDSLRDGKSELVNTNRLIRNYAGATGLKTGSTSLALYNLSATATRNNLSLISVIMRAPNTTIRFNEAQKLLDYGFNTYEFKEFGKKDDIVQNLPVEKGIEQSIEIAFAQNAGTLIKKGEGQSISHTITLPEYVSAPIQKGDKIGEANFTNSDGLITTVDLIANHDVEKVGVGNMIAYLYKLWFCLNRK